MNINVLPQHTCCVVPPPLWNGPRNMWFEPSVGVDVKCVKMVVVHLFVVFVYLPSTEVDSVSNQNSCVAAAPGGNLKVAFSSSQSQHTHWLSLVPSDTTSSITLLLLVNGNLLTYSTVEKHTILCLHS